MDKDKKITKFLKLVEEKFGNDKLSIVNYWSLYGTIGLTRENKLIYIDYYNKSDCYYECEIHSTEDTSGTDFKVCDSDNVTEKQLLEIISKFFEIEIKDCHKNKAKKNE